jgi:hypothetical protein
MRELTDYLYISQHDIAPSASSYIFTPKGPRPVRTRPSAVAPASCVSFPWVSLCERAGRSMSKCTTIPGMCLKKGEISELGGWGKLRWYVGCRVQHFQMHEPGQPSPTAHFRSRGRGLAFPVSRAPSAVGWHKLYIPMRPCSSKWDLCSSQFRSAALAMLFLHLDCSEKAGKQTRRGSRVEMRSKPKHLRRGSTSGRWCARRVRLVPHLFASFKLADARRVFACKMVWRRGPLTPLTRQAVTAEWSI